jgi:hypothetical protein
LAVVDAMLWSLAACRMDFPACIDPIKRFLRGESNSGCRAMIKYKNINIKTRVNIVIGGSVRNFLVATSIAYFYVVLQIHIYCTIVLHQKNTVIIATSYGDTARNTNACWG